MKKYLAILFPILGLFSLSVFNACSKNDHDHALTLTIDKVWVNNLTEHTDLVLEVFAQLDHDGTQVSKSVNFHAHPM